MSRIGRLPITVPAGVDVTIDGADVTVSAELVWLEARGKAFLRCHFESKGNTVTQWSGA